jgi:Zinc-binding
MPESHAAAKRRKQKANREMGIGDEQGRLVRLKDPPKIAKCTICQMEMKITKTNTEVIAHATSKHGSTLEECFPGATAMAAELIAAAGKKTATAGGGDGTTTKAERKAKSDAGLSDLLNAGLTAGKKGKK